MEQTFKYFEIQNIKKIEEYFVFCGENFMWEFSQKLLKRSLKIKSIENWKWCQLFAVKIFFQFSSDRQIDNKFTLK